jgi:hypothetical protein
MAGRRPGHLFYDPCNIVTPAKAGIQLLSHSRFNVFRNCTGLRHRQTIRFQAVDVKTDGAADFVLDRVNREPLSMTVA